MGCWASGQLCSTLWWRASLCEQGLMRETMAVVLVGETHCIERQERAERMRDLNRVS